MAGLHARGVDILVCALPSLELEEMGLDGEAAAARRAGLEFVAIPIVDRGVPDRATAVPILEQLVERLRGGAHIVNHCRFGIGRASLLAASILILDGVAPDDAWDRLGRARGFEVPDTQEQRGWANSLARVAHRPSQPRNPERGGPPESAGF